jgi:hypothetical protein
MYDPISGGHLKTKTTFYYEAPQMEHVVGPLYFRRNSSF